jgi:hypothetical protein
MKEIFIAVKRHDATVTGVILIPVRVALKTMHHAPVIQANKQNV